MRPTLVTKSRRVQAVQVQSVVASQLPQETPPAATDFLGVPVHPVRYDQAWDLIRCWAEQRVGRNVCFAAVAVVIHAHDLPDFRLALTTADLVLPDGMPAVWWMRRSGHPDQQRLCGPDLIFKLCGDAASGKIPVGFLGSTPETLRLICQNFRERWPDLDIRYAYGPPLGPLTEAEDSSILDEINKSGTRLLFVGLGCPKQEQWMVRVRSRSQVIMIGIGAAFDVAAGTRRVPPLWVQRMGLQWAYRLGQEPRRLWRRYLRENTRFFCMLVRHWLSRSTSQSIRRNARR
jgi:N-acetylglucosaminyldiphosphoundecaprenol N-acetyl-beta-D-mannosaminyltransferase